MINSVVILFIGEYYSIPGDGGEENEGVAYVGRDIDSLKVKVTISEEVVKSMMKEEH